MVLKPLIDYYRINRFKSILIIDFVVIKQSTKFRLYDCAVKTVANCTSQHYLVEAKLIIPYQRNMAKLV